VVLVKGFPFMAAEGCNGRLTQPGIRCGQHGTQQGQPVRSQRHEHGCGKRWRGGVTASHGRDTEADEVQRSNELIVMERRTRKLSVQRFTFAAATKRSLAKASIDPRCTSLLDSKDLKVMSTDQERIHDG
jgi:hypothetical protein